jgi:hypothetical protein
LPVPDAAVHDEPVVATQVQVAPVNVAGNVSVIGALRTDDGPALAATIVYVIGVPGVDEAKPSVLVMLRSAVGVNGSVSTAELLPGVVSVKPVGATTAAVFATEPVAPWMMAAVKV